MNSVLNVSLFHLLLATEVVFVEFALCAVNCVSEYIKIVFKQIVYYCVFSELAVNLKKKSFHSIVLHSFSITKLYLHLTCLYTFTVWFPNFSCAVTHMAEFCYFFFLVKTCSCTHFAWLCLFKQKHLLHKYSPLPSKFNGSSKPVKTYSFFFIKT